MAVLAAVVLSASGAEENDPGATDGAMPLDKVIERMETAVPSSTWDAYSKEHPAPFWLFGEDRRFAVRNDIIPAHWFNDGGAAAQCFRGVAQPGEFYPFQSPAPDFSSPVEIPGGKGMILVSRLQAL